jgi:hypothetical protein
VPLARALGQTSRQVSSPVWIMNISMQAPSCGQAASKGTGVSVCLHTMA